MILQTKFRKKEKKIMAGLCLFFSSLGLSAYAADAIPNLSNIVVVTPKHGGEEGAPFYANNIQLEPLDVYFCFSSTPPKNLSLNDLSFYTMKGGSGEGAKHALTLNTNQANDQGFYLYDNTSDYYKMYTKMGFELDGGIFVGKRYQLQALDDSGDTSACNGRNFIEKSVYLRAKNKPGVFNVMITAQNDAGDTISSDAGANNYMTMAPFQYSPNDFLLLTKDFGKWNALGFVRGVGGSKKHTGAKIISDHQWNGGFDYLFNTNPEKPSIWSWLLYNSDAQPKTQKLFFSRTPIDGSAFDKVTIKLTGGSRKKKHKSEASDKWWGLLTGLTTNDIYAPALISVTPKHAAVAPSGRSGNLDCTAHKSTNHWGVQNLWNISKTIDAKNHVYETLRGGIGLPGEYVDDPSIFWIQTVLKHFNNGSQHKYGCGARDDLAFIGYDSYGNEFSMRMKPRIGSSPGQIDFVKTINPYDPFADKEKVS